MLGNRLGQHFDCDLSSKGRIRRPIHLAHAPNAERGVDGVRAKAYPASVP